MIDLLNIKMIFFTVLGYPMSYIEFFGTLLYLWSVWLIARRNVLTWPIGIVSVLLYMMIFYQVHLYSDALEQVYYLGASVYGWLYWSRARIEKLTIADVSYSSSRAIMVYLILTSALSVVLGAIMGHIHLWLPKVFPEAASYPYIDATTTVMSLVAMWLMARKHIESWIYWIIVDLVGIWLYFVKDVKFISLLYVILLALAIRGLYNWIKAGEVFSRTSGGRHDWRARQTPHTPVPGFP
jgi:nicotinamide mononucleotide transporter